jgi:NAD(P)-dependent dehydrogenase (short-subunit alcohol dehydrogenase family)
MKSVVVTGASTGIGEATAARLGAEGFRVFAAVRSDSALEAAAAAGHEPLRLDVTDEASIRDAAATVDEAIGPAGLAGLVNNAGIAGGGPLEYIEAEEMRRHLETNLMGPFLVTQALLPALRRARGRIVNVSSIGARISPPMLGPYAASKAGLAAMSDSLRRELRPWGMHVAVIEPGTIATEIWTKGETEADRMEAALSEEAKERYSRLMDFARGEISASPGKGSPPDVVAKVILHALTSSRPRTRYLVGRDARAQAAVAGLLPHRAFDAVLGRVTKHR